MRMRVAVCLHMQTNGLLCLIPTPTFSVFMCFFCAGAGGFDFCPYTSIAGILGLQHNHRANELGGPVSAALATAKLSTEERLDEALQKYKLAHRYEVVVGLDVCVSEMWANKTRKLRLKHYASNICNLETKPNQSIQT